MENMLGMLVLFFKRGENINRLKIAFSNKGIFLQGIAVVSEIYEVKSNYLTRKSL